MFILYKILCFFLFTTLLYIYLFIKGYLNFSISSDLLFISLILCLVISNILIYFFIKKYLGKINIKQLFFLPLLVFPKVCIQYIQIQNHLIANFRVTNSKPLINRKTFNKNTIRK